MRKLIRPAALVLTASLFTFAVFSQTGGIQGKVSNSQSREALSGAYVSVDHTNFKKVTDTKGEFRFDGIAAGEYDLQVDFVGYSPITRHFVIKDHEITNLEIRLVEKAQELQNVNVFTRVNGETESSSRTVEKRANNIQNVIGAKAMERSPDINAANVLQRMSGVTIQRNSGADDAYAIIRGLEPRYNNTLINSIKIASPDEKSRFVSLDVVPSDLLQKIEISKSLLPEMEGDAIGGTVNLVMKDAPDTKFFKALGSIGYSQLLFDRKYISFSKQDIQQKSLYERYGPSHVAQPDDFSRSNLDFQPTTTIPTAIVGISYGQRFFKNKMGLLIAGNFQNQYYGTNSQQNQAVPDIYENKPVISDVSIINYSTQQLNSGLTLHLDYNFNERNKITLTNVLLYSYLAQSRVSDDTAYIGGNGGRTVPGTGPITTDYSSITDHQIIENLKLDGKHVLSTHFMVDWAVVYSAAAKRTPDRADLNVNKKIDTVHTTNDIHGPYEFVSTPNYFDQISRIWQHNNDQDIDLIANLTYKSKLGNQGGLEIKAGGLYRHKTRYNLQDEYDLNPTTNNTNGVKEEFLDIYSCKWIVYDTKGTQAYDINNYKLHENITAGYLQTKLSFTKLDIFGGLRVENTDQGYTLNTFYATGINGVQKNYTDLLPSIMAKWKLNTKTNIRFSYFKSIARPNYYELVPASLLSNTSATTERGNPYLNHTVAHNFDIRYELFPKEEEQLFIGGFYKKIQNPIEYAYLDVSTYTPQNFGTAHVYGAELVYTKYFGNFGVTGNYTYIYSEIHSRKFKTDLVNRTTDTVLQKRPMQGQTDNTLNLSLLYRNEHSHLFIQLAYEYIGKTLAKVYPIYGYDYYQTPASYLALSAEKQLGNRHFTIFGKFNNLLNTPTTNNINGLLTVKDIYKASYSIGLRFSN